jgi:hypothetical protein
MQQFAVVIINGQTTSVFDWMAKFAAYPQKPWIIAIVSAAVAAVVSVNTALREAVDNAFNSSTQTDALETATATIKFLMRVPGGYYADVPGNVTKKLANIGKLIALPAQEIDSNLATLAEYGILKRIRSRHGDYVEFGSAAAAYFYSCALLDSPDEFSIEELLCDDRLRMTTISLLQAAKIEHIDQFLREMDSLLDSGIDALNKDQLGVPSNRFTSSPFVAPGPSRPQFLQPHELCEYFSGLARRHLGNIRFSHRPWDLHHADYASPSLLQSHVASIRRILSDV